MSTDRDRPQTGKDATMIRIKAWIDCIPPKTTAQAAARIMKRKDGTMFVGKFDSGKGKAAQNDLMALLMPLRPPQPMEGPLCVRLTFCWPWRKSESKRNRATGAMPCDTRPDVDNLCKLIFDCMTRLAYWIDDGQVAGLAVLKVWGDRPGIGLAVDTLAPADALAILEWAEGRGGRNAEAQRARSEYAPSAC